MFGVAVAYGPEHPCEVYSSTTARKHEVVVQFVGLGRGSAECCALDREDDCVVVRVYENVATEAIYWVLPSYRERLRPMV